MRRNNSAAGRSHIGAFLFVGRFGDLRAQVGGARGLLGAHLLASGDLRARLLPRSPRPAVNSARGRSNRLSVSISARGPAVRMHVSIGQAEMLIKERVVQVRANTLGRPALSKFAIYLFALDHLRA